MKRLGLFFGLIFLGVFGTLFITNNDAIQIQDKFNASANPTALPITPIADKNSPTVQPTIQIPTPTTILTITPTGTIDNIKSMTATIKTNKGNIKLSLFPNEAPKTVANFIQKAKSGFYNNLTFHRVEDWVIQGGDPKGNGSGGGDMPVEFNSKPFVVGALGVASRGDGKVQNDAQFFITKSDASWLNGQYTNFGQVIDGMDVVNKTQIGDKILGITLEE